MAAALGCVDDPRAAAVLVGLGHLDAKQLEKLVRDVRTNHPGLVAGNMAEVLELGHRAVQLMLVSSITSALTLPGGQAASAANQITRSLAQLRQSSAKPIYSKVNLKVVLPQT